MRFESETASLPHVPARTSSVSGNTQAVSLLRASLLWRQRRILSHLSPSPLPLRVSIKKKMSVSPHDSQFIQVNVRQHFQVLSSSSWLCVRQIESEQHSTVGEVSQLLEVLALASRLADPDNVVPSLPGSDSWLSKKKQKKIRSFFKSFTPWWRSSYILDVVRTFWTWSWTNNWPVACRARRLVIWLCHLCDLLMHDRCTRQASGMTCDSDVIEKPSRRWRGAVQQFADVVWES